MTKIFESWMTCLTAVFGLIALGALLGHDLVQLHGVSDIVTAIGTLMLGFAAVIAFPVWEQQQRSRFQATVSAECYAKISTIKYKLDRNIPKFQAAKLISGVTNPHEIPSGKPLIKSELMKNIKELISVLEDFVVPRSAILGSKFYDEIEGFAFELTRLTSNSEWQNLTDRHLTDITQRLSDFLCYLRKKSMFEA